jgi:hypothetical protein
MAPRGKKRIFIDDLGKRWGRDADHVLDLAIDGQLPLWIEFTDVFLQTPEKSSTGKSVGRLYEQVAVQPLPRELVQMRGRCDRMLIAAELACLTGRGKEMRLTNAAGEDWGEVSMVGLKPTRLFAWMKDVTGYEKANSIDPVPGYAGESAPARAAATPAALNPVDHPCHAPELHLAVACWQALFADAGAAGQQLKKADVLRWLAEHHGGLAKAAAERIAMVVLPAK